jgi:hypothetical protein
MTIGACTGPLAVATVANEPVGASDSRLASAGATQ